MKSTLKSSLQFLISTALAGGMLMPLTANAACVTAGSTITCTGTDTTGVNAGAGTNLTVNVGASVTTAGDAIRLGAGSILTIRGNVTSTGGAAITVPSAFTLLNIEGTSTISGAINLGSAYATIGGTIDDINITGIGSILYFTGSTVLNGNAHSSNPGNTVTLLGTGTFNSDMVGTQITGFDSYTKDGGSTWTLTGSTKTPWRITQGTLIGTTDNLDSVNTYFFGGIINIDQSSNGTYTGVISGSGSAIISGGGDITFQNANSYNGGTSITGSGTKLIVASDDRLGNAAGGLTLQNGGGLQLGSSFNITRNISLSNGDGILYTPGVNTTLSGTISGTGALVVSDNGTITISGAKTYLGGTRIQNAATLQVSADNNLGDAAGQIALDAGTLRWLSAFDTTRDINIGAGGGTLDHQTHDILLSGDLSGTGLLTLNGSGDVVLTGSSTKTGGFNILAGTLAGNTTNLSGGNITNAGTLIFDQAAAGTFSGNIVGTGDFIKNGIGNLILSGTNTYSGTTQVNAGRLSVNGSLTGTDVTVAAGATIGGNGQIGQLDLLGTIAPGNSIGTLNTGNLTFGTNSIYEVEVNDALQTDLINITGTLDIDPSASVSVVAANGSYAANNNYTIITHTGTRTGTFANVTSNLAFLTPSLIYNANNIQLLLTNNNISFDSVAKDHVQRDVASNIEQLGAGNSIYDAFSGLTVEDAQRVLDDASGEHFAGLTGALTESVGLIRNILSSRLEMLSKNVDSSNASYALAMNLRDVQNKVDSSSPELYARNTSSIGANNQVWVEAFGMTGKTDARRTAAKQDRDTVGTVAGIDGALGEKTRLGFFGGFETGQVKSKSEKATSDINNYHAGVYTNYDLGDGFHLNGGIGGTYHNIQSKRHVVFGGLDETPKSDTNGYTATGFLEAGYLMNASSEIALEPFIGVSTSYTYINGYTETDGNALNLKVEDMTSFTPAHSVGIRMGNILHSEDGMETSLKSSLAWQHSYGDLKDESEISFASGTNSGFTTYGPGRTRDAALVGMGLHVDLQNGTNIQAGYSGSLSVNSQDHVLRANLNYQF